MPMSGPSERPPAKVHTACERRNRSRPDAPGSPTPGGRRPSRNARQNDANPLTVACPLTAALRPVATPDRSHRSTDRARDAAPTRPARAAVRRPCTIEPHRVRDTIEVVRPDPDDDVETERFRELVGQEPSE